jgi:hypothetical protein
MNLLGEDNPVSSSRSTASQLGTEQNSILAATRFVLRCCHAVSAHTRSHRSFSLIQRKWKPDVHIVLSHPIFV